MYCVRWPAVVVLAASVTLSGCGGSDDRVVVFAASSLTDVFDRLEGEYEAANPGVDVVVTTAGSSSLVAQFVDGAPVDVLATADEPTMARARAAASIEADPIDFARNELVIAVELGNPLDIGGLGKIVRIKRGLWIAVVHNPSPLDKGGPPVKGKKQETVALRYPRTQV